MRRRYKRQEVINENLIENSRLKDEEIEDLKREIDTLRQYDPHMWLELAGRERKDGNEEKAITALRSGVMLTNDALHEAYLTLARHHVAIYPDQGESLHLNEAERLAQVATLLKPYDNAAASLLEEIRETMAMEDIHRGRYHPDDLHVPNATAGLYGSDLGAKVVDQLIDVGKKHHRAGRYIVFERLTHRARIIGLRELGATSEHTLKARSWWATALTCNGLYLLARTEIEGVLKIYNDLREDDSRGAMLAHFVYAGILDNLGNCQEALEEIEKLLPLQKDVFGSEHPETLLAHLLHASILYHLRYNQIALYEVEKLLHLMKDVNGVRHPDTLQAHLLHVWILFHRRSYQEALSEVENLLDLMKDVNGAQHPDTLSTRFLHALILNDLSNHQEALNLVNDFLPLQERSLGTEHPRTLITRLLHATILNDLGSDQEALNEVEVLLPSMERVFGAQVGTTLSVRSLKGKILKKLKG